MALYWYGSRTRRAIPDLLPPRGAGPGRVYDDEKVAEEPMLDLNELATTRKFVALNGMAVSPDERWLAYAVDATGARDFELHIRTCRPVRTRSWPPRRTPTPLSGPQTARPCSTSRHNEAAALTSSGAICAAPRRATCWCTRSRTTSSTCCSSSRSTARPCCSAPSQDTMDWRLLPADQPTASWRGCCRVWPGRSTP